MIDSMDSTAPVLFTVGGVPHLQVIYYSTLMFAFNRDTKDGVPAVRLGAWQVIDEGPKEEIERKVAAWNKKLVSSPEEMLRNPGYPVSLCLPTHNNLQTPTPETMEKIISVLQEIPVLVQNPNSN